MYYFFDSEISSYFMEKKMVSVTHLIHLSFCTKNLHKFGFIEK